MGYVVFCGVIALAGAAAAQEVSAVEPQSLLEWEENADPTSPLVFEGFVYSPEGAPAKGAVVRTSAGGRAVVEGTGYYRLVGEAPVGAESVQVTAVGRGDGSLVASATVLLWPPSGLATVGPLFLAHSGGCSPEWLPTFGGGLGVNGYVRVLAAYDDGTTAALYAGGDFTTAGGGPANRIAKWDGVGWSALASGMDSTVTAIATYDDGGGGGAKLYAGGSFSVAGGIAASHIAKWDGGNWSPVGGGLGANIRALAVFNDGFGGGAELYAAGNHIGGGHMTKWDGSSWSALGSGPNAGVSALAVFDGGTGAALYVGGAFTTVGAHAANRIAKWDAFGWSALGSGMSNAVYALTVFDDGGGDALYAGGAFDTAGGVAANRVAKWDGSSWSALGSGTNNTVLALSVFDDGSGAALYAGGEFTTAGGVAVNRIAKWDGATWSAVGGGMNLDVNALAKYDDGGG